MSSRRRANNRGGRSRPKTNLDDLDGALTSMITSTANNNVNVKLTNAPNENESRFTMHSAKDSNDFAASQKEDLDDDSGFRATHTADFEKHQVNYGATKYIKP